MGWTNYNATHYKTSGSVDRKAECDRQFVKTCEVVKSAMAGSIYWAAVRNLKDGTIWPVCILTRTTMNADFNFWYKDIPARDDYSCPSSILNALPVYSGEYKDLEDWKAECRKRAEKKTSPDSLRNLPLGSVIRIKRYDWDTNGSADKEYTKTPPMGHLKKPFWLGTDGKYIPKKWIPDDYVVVRRGYANTAV